MTKGEVYDSIFSQRYAKGGCPVGRDKALEVGRTKLGEINAITKEGKYVTLSVFYGNYLYPMVDGEYQHQTQEAYMGLLKAFLDSEAGREYKIPTQQEINAACLAVANREKEFIEKARAEKERETEKNRKQPTPIYEDENVVPPHLRAEYTKPKPQPQPEEERVFEDDEIPEEEEKKKVLGIFGKKKDKPAPKPKEAKESDKLLEEYKRRSTVLTVITVFLTLLVGFELLWNVYLLTVIR